MKRTAVDTGRPKKTKERVTHATSKRGINILFNTEDFVMPISLMLDFYSLFYHDTARARQKKHHPTADGAFYKTLFSLLWIISISNVIELIQKLGYLAFGDPDENRTRITAVKGRCLDRLTTGPGSGCRIRTNDTPGMNRVL